MKLSTLHRLPPRWRARAMRAGFNLHPVFRGTGGRVDYVSPDLLHIRAHLPLRRRTRNMVGSLFGGSLFAITDGVHVAMLMASLRRDVVIWDKSAAIRYRRPAYSTLYVDFRLDHAELDAIRQALDADQETERCYTLELKDAGGVTHTIVERRIYIANTSYYHNKRTRTPVNGGSCT